VRKEDGGLREEARTKICGGKGCGRELPVEEFRLKRQVKNGKEYLFYNSYCKECEAAFNRESYSRNKEQVYQRVNKWKKKNRKKVRAANREYQTIKRRERGVSYRGPWKKYRVQERKMLAAGPLLDWIGPLWGGLSEDRQAALRRARRTGELELGAVDRILFELGAEHMLPVLYREEEDAA
jgi:hypothetical protein